ncbi:MAG: winged helix-turn-helix domain-containing protein [Candidatus Sericytochromatia bacterium]|nr:winged helix-turn-helix domain-containing protein [Candidatus Sericytochromatia bacterium]
MELWSLGASGQVMRSIVETARRHGWRLTTLETWSGLRTLESDSPRPRVGHVHLPGEGIEQGTRLAAILSGSAGRLGPVLVTLDHAGARARHLAWATGCSEVLVAPLDPLELDMRLAALARRALRARPRAQEPQEPTGTPWIQVDDQLVRLTPSEAAILHYLAHRPGRHVSARELLACALGYEPGEGHPDIIRTHMRRLRGKLGSSRNAVGTRAGQGYRWDGATGLRIREGLPRIVDPEKATRMA